MQLLLGVSRLRGILGKTFMKKLVVLFFVLAVSGIVSLAGGVDDPEKNSTVAVMKGSNGRLKVFYKGDGATFIKISIFDESNNLRFNERIKAKPDFVRPYDLSDLKKGTYKIVVETPGKTYVDSYTYGEKPSLFAHVQKLKGDNSKYLLTVADPAAEEVQVDVLNAAGRLLMTHKIVGKGQFAQVYNFNKIEGEVFFQVSTDNGTVTAEN